VAVYQWVLAQLTARGAGLAPRVDMLGPMRDATDQTLEFNLRGACTAGWKVSGLDEHARFVHELTTDLFVWRDRRLIFRGRVGSVDDDVDAAGHEMTCSAVDYRGLMARRVLMVPHDYVGWHPQHIALDMVNIAQLDVPPYSGGGQLGVVDDLGPLGPTVDEFYERDTNVMENIDRLADRDDPEGLEWWIDPHPDWETDPDRQLWFHTCSWRGDPKPEFPIILGTTADRISRSFSTEDYANHVIVRGGSPPKPPDPPDVEKGEDPAADNVPDWPGTWTMRTPPPWPPGRYTPDARWYQPPAGDDGKESKQDRQLWYWRGDGWFLCDELPEVWQARDAGEWHRRPMGRLSKVVSNNELVTQEAVDQAADVLLAESLRPAAAYQCELRDGIWTSPADAWLGDRISIYLRSGRLDVQTTARIWQIKLSVAGDGTEKVELTLDQTDTEDWS